MQIPFKKTSHGIILKVRVLPRSSKKGIEITPEGLKVKLTAPPVGGAANEQLVEVLSEAFRIRRSAFRILKGLSSKDKVVEITGADDISNIHISFKLS
ncbi:MAG TPA: DUF167 domain-containing protein [Thermodesulfovibrionales bacterium]|nr:DUF167 domain-containing protein [Thermodesulfovibrionales bacterium]